MCFKRNQHYLHYVLALLIGMASMLSVTHIHVDRTHIDYAHVGYSYADYVECDHSVEAPYSIAEYFETCGAFHIVGLEKGTHNQLISLAPYFTHTTAYVDPAVAAVISSIYRFHSRAPPLNTPV